MKHKALTVFAILLVLAGLTMLIVPKISNRIGEQIAHSTIEDFKALKSKATTDEPTEKKGSDEDGLTTVDSNDPQRDNSTVIRLADILENQPLAFDDDLIRQMLQCVVVQSKDCIKIIFNDGTEVDQPIK